MRAIVIANDAPPALEHRPDPVAVGECLVGVRLAGICGTDLELLRGYAAFQGIPGHEFVGVVEDAPPGERHWIGRRVVGEINVACGRCPRCRTGLPAHCDERTVVGIRGRPGAFADRLTLPARNLHAVPESLTDEEAVFVEPVAAACEILEQLDLTAASQVGVVGDGRLGLLVGQVMRTTGASVRLFGRHAAKLRTAAAVGIDAAPIDAAPTDRPFDVVVDATGRAEGVDAAVGLVRPRGTVVLKSTRQRPTPMRLEPIVVHEITLVGSRCGPFGRAIAMLVDGSVRTAPLVSAILPIERFEEAFALARRRLKVLLRVAGGAA